MKKSVLNFVLVVAMMAAASFAFANKKAPSVNTVKAHINGQWVPIPSEEYSCLTAPNEQCTAEFDAQDNMIPETLQDGRFVAE